MTRENPNENPSNFRNVQNGPFFEIFLCSNLSPCKVIDLVYDLKNDLAIIVPTFLAPHLVRSFLSQEEQFAITNFIVSSLYETVTQCCENINYNQVPCKSSRVKFLDPSAS